MELSFRVRLADPSDAETLLEIYRPYVETTAISFELVVPSVLEFAHRIETYLGKWSWLVVEVDSHIAGYAYASPHRAREAYAFSVETSVYIRESYHRLGLARRLYAALFAKLEVRGYESAFAGVTLPNEASVWFHRSFGFAPIGVFPRVGYKFNKWHDVQWLYRPIREPQFGIHIT